mgnify:FL=1|jgi:hypothetical protein
MADWSVRVNKSSVSAKIKALEANAEEAVKDELERVAWALVSGSPVDTGAYILSHTFSETGGKAGRRISSEGKPRKQDWGTKAGEAMQNLRDDIQSADLSKGYGIFRNRAPHAVDVENKYLVYTKSKDRFR